VDPNHTGTNENGFGVSGVFNTSNFQAWSWVEYDDLLFVSVVRLQDGSRVMYTSTGSTSDDAWAYSVGGGTAVADGFGDVTNIGSHLYAFDLSLYAGTISNVGFNTGYTTNGADIWKGTGSGASLTWTRVTGDGFGDKSIAQFEAFTTFGGQMYVAGSNIVASGFKSDEESGYAGTKVFRLASGPLDDYDLDGVANNIDNCPLIPNSLQEDTGDSDGVGDACDNCSSTPNGPNGGTCICGGNSCMSDNDCDYGSCSMNQEDTNNDGVGDVCDQALCRAYLCRYENCSALKAAGREVDYNVCKPIQNQQVCIAAGCSWWNSPSAFPCMLDICLMDWDGKSGVGGGDFNLLKREYGRSCPTTHQPGDNLCQMYYNQYQTCVALDKAGSELDYYVCKGLSGTKSPADKIACENAGCTWYDSPSAFPCMLDICLMNWDVSSGVGGGDFNILKREFGRSCPYCP
jgi:hypothetical protein